jgi:integrase
MRHSGLFKRCGHSVRAWPTCADPWWFRFHHGGHEYRFSLNKEERKPPDYEMDKDEARKLYDKYRYQIREGEFRKQPTTLSADVRLTVGDVMKQYLDSHVRSAERKKAGQVVMEAYVKRLGAMHVPAANGTTIALDQKPIDAVTTADVDVLRRGWTLNTNAASGGRTGPIRALKRLRHFFNWAIEKGHIERTPFKRGDQTVVHFAKEPGRTRRLEGDEEQRLLKHAATPLVRALIVAGLESGCRIGELLQLTWRDVKWDHGVLLLPAAITKTSEPRDIPLTQKLRALLDVRKHAPDGSEHGADAFVFGDEFGLPVKYWRVNQAWHATCDAAGIEWRKHDGVEGLNFHDLRRELASTLRESGAPDHIVADVLGHADISTTSRYLKASRAGLKRYVERLEQHRREVAAQRKAEQKKQRRKDSHTVRTRGARTASNPSVENPSKTLN